MRRIILFFLAIQMLRAVNNATRRTRDLIRTGIVNRNEQQMREALAKIDSVTKIFSGLAQMFATRPGLLARMVFRAADKANRAMLDLAAAVRVKLDDGTSFTDEELAELFGVPIR